MKKIRIITVVTISLLILFAITSSAFACSNYSQEKDFQYITYNHTPSVSCEFPLCNGSYYNTATSWWYDYSTPDTSGWILKYFEGISSNYSTHYYINGYSVYFWTHGGWGQITDFNITIQPYATLDTGRLDLIAAYPYMHYGTGRRGEYYSINFTILTSDSTNYTIYQEVYPHSY